MPPSPEDTPSGAIADAPIGFGPFRLDLAGARLLRDGRPVDLTPKCAARVGF